MVYKPLPMLPKQPTPLRPCVQHVRLPSPYLHPFPGQRPVKHVTWVAPSQHASKRGHRVGFGGLCLHVAPRQRRVLRAASIGV